MLTCNRPETCVTIEKWSFTNSIYTHNNASSAAELDKNPRPNEPMVQSHLLFSWVLLPQLLDPEGLLLVHVGEHEGDVGGEQVVHLVAQGRLAEQLGSPHEVPDGHVEVGVARRPVADAGERVGHQDLLQGERELVN